MRKIIVSALLALLFFSLAHVTKGETWQRYLDRTDSLIVAGQTDSARVVLDDAISTALTIYEQSDTTITRKIWWKGERKRVFFRSHAQAETLFTRIVAAQEKLDGPSDPKLTEMLLNLGNCHLLNREYEEGKRLAERVLHIRDLTPAASLQDVGSALGYLAYIAAQEKQIAVADSLYQQSLSILETELGPDSPVVAGLLYSYGYLNKTQRNYEAADSLYKRSLAITEKTFGTDDLEVTRALSGLAGLAHAMNRFDEFQRYLERILAIQERELGPNDSKVAETLSNLGVAAKEKGEYQKAADYYKRALELKEQTLEPNDDSIACTLVNMGVLYESLAKPELALECKQRALRIHRVNLPPDDIKISYDYHNIAVTYQALGQFEKAESLFLDALVLIRKYYGGEHYDIAWNYGTLGSLYQEMGRYAEAEELLRRAVALRKEAFGNEHLEVAQSLNGLARICTMQGKFVEAELLYRETLAIYEKLLGPDHPKVSYVLSSLAWLYENQLKYDDAEQLYRRILAIRKKAYDPDHPAVASTLTGLAYICKQRGDYEQAEQLNRRALAIREKTLGRDHPTLIWNESELASVLQLQGKYDEAEKIFKKVIADRKTSLGLDHPYIADDLNNLALLYQKQEKYEEALALQVKALNIVEKSFAEEHSGVAWILQSMCTTLRQQDRNEDALVHAERACRMWQNIFRENAGVLTEQDALAYSHYYRSAIDNYLTCCADVGFDRLPESKRLFDIVLSGKGQIADEMYERAQKVASTNADSVTARLLESHRLTKFQLANLFTRGAHGDVYTYQSKMDSLSERARNLEAELSRQGFDVRKQRERDDISVERITSLMPEGAALVEYIKYTYLPVDTTDEYSRYLAVVIPGEEAPSILDLGSASEVEPLIEQYRRHMEAMSGRDPTAFDQRMYRKLGNKLYTTLWEPIDQRLRDDVIVLISPDGALNLVSFAGLVDQGGSYLIERRPLHYLASARDLIRLNHEATPASGLLTFGDPDFSATVAARMQPASDGSIEQSEPIVLAGRNVRSFSGDFSSMHIAPLPGTRHEVEAIVEKWKQATNEKFTVRLGPDASEERFKSEGAGNRVIHLATHGYFLKNIDRRVETEERSRLEQNILDENPLLQSGLFFAGANLHGEEADSAGAEDGILTAYEVSTMDLRGTELVVLSACETGLGAVKEGEGVYGLRRAFQMAGARTVVSALWPVSDQVTAEIMSDLYGKRDVSLPEILRNAQLKKIRNARAEGLADHPVTWGAFIAIGDWR